jgi:hypothetical protein
MMVFCCYAQGKEYGEKSGPRCSCQIKLHDRTRFQTSDDHRRKGFQKIIVNACLLGNPSPQCGWDLRMETLIVIMNPNRLSRLYSDRSTPIEFI